MRRFMLAALFALLLPVGAQAQITDSITVRVFGPAVAVQIGDDCRPDPNDTQPLADVVLNVGTPRSCTITGLDSNGDPTPVTVFATTRDTTVAQVDSVTANDDFSHTIHFTTTGPGFTSIIIQTEEIQSAMGIILQRTDPSTFTWMEFREDASEFGVDGGLWCVPGEDKCVQALTGRNYQMCWYRFVGSSMAGKSDAACPYDTPVLGDEVIPENGLPMQQTVQLG